MLSWIFFENCWKFGSYVKVKIVMGNENTIQMPDLPYSCSNQMYKSPSISNMIP